MQTNDVEHYYCGNCKYFKVDADRNESLCKRIDHKTIKFAIPYFKSYDCGQYRGCICSDFVPADYCVHAKKNWTNFDEYWIGYVEQWLPYSNTNTYISFTLNNDTSIRYRVKLLDYVYNTMFDGNTLKAYEKVYYKQCRDKEKYPTGYKLIVEEINGVEV